MLNSELEKKLQKEISKSGYPVELDIVENLRDAGYLVSSNVTYNTRQSSFKEIDAIAFSATERSVDWPFGTVGNILAVECKRQREKPWVFFEEVYDPLAGLGLVIHADIMTELEYTDGYSVVAGCMNSPLSSHHFNAHLPTARTYFEAFRPSNHENIIFKAIQSVWYALAFIHSWFDENKQVDESQADGQNLRTSITQGVIVLDGQLILASKTDEGFTLTKSEHIVLRTIDCVTGRSTSPSLFGKEVLIDVVSYDSFPAYLTQSLKNSQLLEQHLIAQYRAGWIAKP